MPIFTPSIFFGDSICESDRQVQVAYDVNCFLSRGDLHSQSSDVFSDSIGDACHDQLQDVAIWWQWPRLHGALEGHGLGVDEDVAPQPAF